MFGSGLDDIDDMNWPQGRNIPSICTDFKYRAGADGVFVFMVSKLGESLEQHEVRELLNKPRPNGVSLVLKAAQRFLAESLEVLVQHGALLGGSTTAMAAVRDICNTGCPDIADRAFRENYLDQRERIRRLLGRTMCTTVLKDRGVTFRYYVASKANLEEQGVSELSGGSLRGRMHKWHVQGEPEGHMMWIHVPATNVRLS